MKKFVMFTLIAVFSVAVLCAGSVKRAEAISIGFFGNYTISDANADADVFRETISFSNVIGPNSGAITTYTPAIDGLFDDLSFETITLADLELDPTSYVAGDYFDFFPTTYSGGFKIHDDNGDLLLTADLTVTALNIESTTASINSVFSMNLTSITAPVSYVSGSSVIIDAFLAAQAAGFGGALSATLQTPGDISASIINAGGVNGSSITNTYSGTAAPVPEPGTIALLGIGLAGLVGVGVRRRAKKNAA